MNIYCLGARKIGSFSLPSTSQKYGSWQEEGEVRKKGRGGSKKEREERKDREGRMNGREKEEMERMKGRGKIIEEKKGKGTKKERGGKK